MTDFERDSLALQLATLNGLTLLVRFVQPLLPEESLRMATVRAWVEGSQNLMQRVSGRPHSEFDPPLDDRTFYHDQLGEMLAREIEQMKRQDGEES